QEALQFDNLSLELDVWSSLSRRQWTLANVGIQGPSFTLGEQTDGSWQLLGFEGSGAGVDPDQVLALVSRVGYLSLSDLRLELQRHDGRGMILDRKSTRLNSSHVKISYAVFCLKKKKKIHIFHTHQIMSRKHTRAI